MISVLLTLTIGLAQINIPAPSNDAFAIDRKIKNKLAEICPSNIESEDITGALLGLVKSCLKFNNPLPHPNDETATLTVTTILRANCSAILSCPLPDGFVIITNSKEPEFKSVLTPTTGIREGMVRYTFENVPVGFEYDIRAIGGASIFFAISIA